MRVEEIRRSIQINTERARELYSGKGSDRGHAKRHLLNLYANKPEEMDRDLYAEMGRHLRVCPKGKCRDVINELRAQQREKELKHETVVQESEGRFKGEEDVK